MPKKKRKRKKGWNVDDDDAANDHVRHIMKVRAGCTIHFFVVELTSALPMITSSPTSLSLERLLAPSSTMSSSRTCSEKTLICS